MWSKINKEHIFKKYDSNALAYHNVHHLLNMYQYLEDSEEPYNEALDNAILYHDIIYDNLPDKELRSAKYMIDRTMLLDYNSIVSIAYDLIMATKEHLVTDLSYSPIIRADLHGLTSIDTVLANYYNILHESIDLYNIDEKTFAKNNINFMEGLRSRVLRNANMLDPTHKDFYKKVAQGIDLTIKLSQAIIQSEL